MNRLEELFKEKYGVVRGAQVKLAKELKLTQGLITNWITGRRQPNIDHILKMSKIFKKSEDELKKIFGVEEKYHQSIGNRSSHNTQSINGNLEIYRDKLTERLEKIEEKLKLIETKQDLILEKLKDKR